MDNDSDQLVLKMFLELIPKDVTKDYVPYSEEIPYNNSFRDFNDRSLAPVPAPVDSHLNGGELNPEYDEQKLLFSDNIKMLPEINDMCAMEIELSGTNDENEFPSNVESDVPLQNSDPSITITNPSCSETLQVKCLQSMESLRRQCKHEGLKFNGYLGRDVLQLAYRSLCKKLSNGYLKEVEVECLSDLPALKEMCEDQNLKFNCSAEYMRDPAHRVDMIFSHKIVNDDTYYYVKWKNSSSKKNTWEPFSRLIGCLHTIKYYHAVKDSKTRLNSKLLKYFVRDLLSRRPYDILTLTRMCAVVLGKSKRAVQKLNLSVSQMRIHVRKILNFPPMKLYSFKNKLFQIMQFAEARKRVLINVKEWQNEINLKNKTAYIEVENNVDLETAPSGFEFIHDYINTVMTAPEEPVAFCNCKNCYNEKDGCCPYDSEGHFAYNRYRRLILEPGYPIFECNRKCSCDNDCINRVVQHGQKVKVKIFRTSNGRGWGLKTLETIEKGQFVLEYLGEIITSEAAEARGHIYDYVGRSYLFDLDYGVDNSMCCFTIDAGHVGNASHFINHSCNPNLHVFAVWINQPDPALPRLAFFAKRKIYKDEELTFDYKMVQKDRFGSQNSMSEDERILCKCNSKNCRKYLF